MPSRRFAIAADQVVRCVAINLLAIGVTRFFSALLRELVEFAEGRGVGGNIKAAGLIIHSSGSACSCAGEWRS